MKKTHAVWFVIITYKPDPIVIAALRKNLAGNPVIEIDNTYNNVGYGGGANKGMKKAFDAGARWVLVMNQDITLTKAGITKFVTELEQSAPGIVGPEAGELDAKRWTTILPGNKKIDYISGAVMAIHRDVYEHIGGFYAPYFMYYEDADISVRAKNAGFELRHVETEGFGHGIPGQARNDNTKEYYLARNHLWFVWRLAPWHVKWYELVRLPKTIYDYRR